MEMNNTTATTSSGVAKVILPLAAWFGLVTGLVEGTVLLALNKNGWLFWRLSNRAISLETIWISALFDLLLFTAVGLILVIVARCFRRLPIFWISIFVFVFLALFDWLLVVLYGKFRVYAILVLALGLAFEISRRFYRHDKSLTKFVHRSLPWLAALALVLLVGIQGGFWLRERTAIARLPQAAPGTPNILVIVVDTLRADHLSSYGYDRATSPNLERIAQQGVLFEHAFSTSSWTQPSHASLLTGRYTYEHDAELRPLDDRYPTIAEALQDRGYRTGAFSANVLFFTRRQGFGRGFVHFEDNFHSIADMAANTLYGFVAEFFVLRRAIGFEGVIARKLASDINHSALRWIDCEPGKPFFVFVNYFDVHDPYVPPQPYRSRFSDLENPGGLVNGYLERYHPSLTPDQMQSEIDAYDGATAYVDDQIGQLLAELEERGLADNTLVIITSDHGESFGEHGLVQHSNALYLEEIRVPLILWWPGHVPEGERVATPVTNAALAATLLDIIGDEQSHFPGPPLTQLWNTPGTPLDWPNPVSELAHYPWGAAQAPSAYGDMKSVISPQWHYITHDEYGEELYDWLEDPTESINLAQNQDAQPVMARFRADLESLLVSFSAWVK
jgi:arylsulfatase A-like enzyme